MPLDQKTEFKYGWCNTDHKTGKLIRKDFRDIDYFGDEPYATSTRKMLERMGLPIPAADQIFRGTHHDLLFLDSHNVVLRIGPADIADTVNPAMLQPLGWFDDPENEFSVAIYPGIEPLKNRVDGSLFSKLLNTLSVTKQDSQDVAETNSGVIHIRKDGQTIPVPVVLDVDSQWNKTRSPGLRLKKYDLFKKPMTENLSDSVELLEKTVTSVYALATGLENWVMAFLVHQPLRNMFWLACRDRAHPDDMPDMDKMAAFWDKCAAVSQAPDVNIIHTHTGDHANPMTLYKPWTGQKSDRTTKFVDKDLISQWDKFTKVTGMDKVKDTLKTMFNKNAPPRLAKSGVNLAPVPRP